MEKNTTNEKYSKEDIDRGLKTLPSLIARAATEHNQVLEEVDIAKHELKIKEATSLISHSRKDYIASEKNALVDLDVGDLEVALIKVEGRMRAKKITFDQLRDSFDSVRKAANIVIEEMKAFGVKDTK